MKCCRTGLRAGLFSLRRASKRSSDAARIVGRTPWSARVPLDPLFMHSAQTDEGVGCGPEGPPHNPEYTEAPCPR